MIKQQLREALGALMCIKDANDSAGAKLVAQMAIAINADIIERLNSEGNNV